MDRKMLFGLLKEAQVLKGIANALRSQPYVGDYWQAASLMSGFLLDTTNRGLKRHRLGLAEASMAQIRLDAERLALFELGAIRSQLQRNDGSFWAEEVELLYTGELRIHLNCLRTSGSPMISRVAQAVLETLPGATASGKGDHFPIRIGGARGTARIVAPPPSTKKFRDN